MGLTAIRQGQAEILRVLGRSPSPDVNFQHLILLVTNLTANMAVMTGRLDQLTGVVSAMEGKSREQGELCVATKAGEEGWSWITVYGFWKETRRTAEAYLAVLTLQLGHRSRFGFVLVITISVSYIWDPLVLLFFAGVQAVHLLTGLLESAHELLDRCPTFLIRPRETSRRAAAAAELGDAEVVEDESADEGWWFLRALSRIWPRANTGEVIPVALP